MARRIAAILLMQPDLDKNYRRIADNAFALSVGTENDKRMEGRTR